MIKASIDIGSNSILLLIAEQTPDGLCILEDHCRVTGLAKKLDVNGNITDDNLNRSLEAIKFYKQRINQFNITQLQAVATESLRRPKNGEDCRKRLSETLGYPITLIDGDQEAQLSFLSVQREHPKIDRPKVVFDIGGASTEIAFGNHQGIQQKTSLKIGSVVLTEKFQLDQASNPREAYDFALGMIESSEFQKPGESSVAVGVAGTITVLLAIENSVAHYSRQAVHLKTISRQRIEYWRDLISQMSLKERERIVGLPQNRADVFPAGLVILSALCEYFGWLEITCMDSGVRFGLLFQSCASASQ